MVYYLIAAGLILHALFWGIGAAWLLLPRRWRPWAWIFAPGLGWSLQSAVVWAGAHFGWPGTDAYALPSELVPLALLIAGWLRGRRAGRGAGRRAWCAADLPVLLGIVAIGGWFVLSPMAASGRGLTSTSLGSCDQADYAAGARTFEEFSRSDRTGLLGQAEVTRLGSTEYFFDFWLRLNHFTPPALLAHAGAIFHLKPYRLVSVLGAVLLLGNVPLAYFLARVAVGARRSTAYFLASLYAISPLSAYAVHQGALGQLLAAGGLGLVLVTAVLLYREFSSRRSCWRLALLAGAAFWLLAGSYNFILVVCLAQAAPWLVARAWLERTTTALWRTAGAMVAALLVCGILFWPRIAGILERFQLFADHDYGWRVPLLSWDGWLGFVRDPYLEPLDPIWRSVILAGLAVAWIAWLGRAWRTQRDRALSALALVLPVAAGCCILAWESLGRANASYDAFKLLSVFYPGLLAGVFAGFAAGWRTWPARGAALFALVVLAVNLTRAEDMREKMSRPPLRVEKHLVALGRIESMPQVTSLNLRIDRYWARLWADAFLLRKPHYFEMPTYEGRNVTELRGEWDLRYAILRVEPASAGDEIAVDENFQLVRAAAVAGYRIEFGAGWNARENFGTDEWRWSKGGGEIRIVTPAGPVRTMVLRLRAEGLHPRDRLEITLNGTRVAAAQLGPTIADLGPWPVALPPGESRLTLVNLDAGRPAGQTDPRTLGVGLHTMVLQLPEAGATR